MPYSATLAFHLLQGLLGFLSVLYLFSQREKFHISPLKKYFTWFVFFVLYNVVLIIFTFVYDAVPVLSAVGYQIALVFLAIAAWQAFLTALEFLNMSDRTRRMLAILYITGAFLAVGIHFTFFEVPHALNANWLLWYPNQIVAIPYILFMFLAGWTFSFALARALFSASHIFLRTRALFMSISGFVLPFAALFYFAASKLSHIYMSFGIVIFAMALFVLGNIGVGMLWKREH